MPSDYPWGRNEVDRDESGKIKTRKWLLGRDIAESSLEYPGLAAQLGREGAGAPLRDKSGKPRTRIIGNAQHIDDTTGQNKDVYAPWGRPGAGAPKKDRYGHPTGTGVYGACTEKRSAHEHVVADKRAAGRGYGMDVASWMRTGEIGMPKPRNPVTGEPIGTNKKTSDVTAIVSKILFHHLVVNNFCIFCACSDTTSAHLAHSLMTKDVASILPTFNYRQNTGTKNSRDKEKRKESWSSSTSAR